jgi:hypothetical protein
MNVKEIIVDYLKKNGFEGLYNADGECGCLLEDLMPCGEGGDYCEPGYKRPCDCGDHDFHVIGVGQLFPTSFCPALIAKDKKEGISGGRE